MNGTGSLEGSVAVVTGATRGIGKGCAIELALAGATVIVTGRTRHEGDSARRGSLDATVQEIAALGGHATAFSCDHSDDAAVAALFAHVAAEHGRLDILVNNAARFPTPMNPRTPFWETPISDWDTIIDIGTRSAYVCTHHAAQMMVPAGSGLVVNITSAGAVRYFHHLVYGIGKEAVDRFTRDASRSLAGHSVAIVSVWPFLVRTETVLDTPELADASTESARFPGRGVVALATDPDVIRRTGRAFTTRTLADLYGFTDIDGSLPPEQPWTPPE